MEISDDEDDPVRDDSVEVIEISDEQHENDNDTPEIEDLISNAEESNLPDFILKTMKDFKKRKDEVFIID